MLDVHVGTVEHALGALGAVEGGLGVCGVGLVDIVEVVGQRDVWKELAKSRGLGRAVRSILEEADLG